MDESQPRKRRRVWERTKRVMTNVYRTRMNRNLKKCAASCVSPTIQYVLAIVPSVLTLLGETPHLHRRQNNRGENTEWNNIKDEA